MPDYRRAFVPGGTFFFTVVTADRRPIFEDSQARHLLHHSLVQCRAAHPFTLAAMVLLPDHLHALWVLPEEDADFSRRWAAIKARFTHDFLAAGGHETERSPSRIGRGSRGIWQRRFWEHLVRDDNDFAQHLDYIHYNPVKHALATCPHEWPHSTFQKWVGRAVYEPAWQCTCGGRTCLTPVFDRLALHAME